jgi:S-methylmethionine-dependent homocysteine/selenocysteine methylase
MAKYRNNLPQLSGDLFITDGGFETTLIFHDGFELPEFAAFDLLKHDQGSDAIRKYYRTYISIAKTHKVGFILESATWRASPDWGKKLGYSDEELAAMNHRAIELLSDIRDEYEDEQTSIVISGCIGPRSDGYTVNDRMSVEEAEAYHTTQIQTLSETEVDMVSAFTINYVEEAIGIVLAAKKIGIPVVISFTLETDGKLPIGQALKEAILEVDSATNNYPVYYMINCAHPTHFYEVLVTGEPWTQRIRGIRANASKKSHAELDEATELDDGNPKELGIQ